MKSINHILAPIAALIFAFSIAGEQAYSQMSITVSTTEVTCEGDSDGSAYISNITNGLPPYTYEWWDESGLRPETTDSITGLPGGNYTCIVRDATAVPGPQFASDDENVDEALVIKINNVNTTPTDCFGDSTGWMLIIAIHGKSPREYSIDTGKNFQPSPFFFNKPARDYSIVVTDANGCDVSWGSNPATINDAAPILITSVDSTHVTCDTDGDGIIDVDAGGGAAPLIYDIIGSALPDNGTGIFSPLGPGNYSVDVTDQNGCGPFNTTNIEILNPDPITILSEDTTNITCNLADDGTITVEGQGGTGTLYYTLNPDAITNTTGFFPGIDPGAAYSVDVTDDNTCPIATAGPWDFLEPDPITIADTTLVDVDCNL
ncbi:MAG TPA: hypothetical protein ENI20_14110, partial [Bacteroides sp.]|nr:hypothetical protein [Bacteroides sp.]